MDWFKKGMQDALEERYEPPTMRDGARARSEYDIGHYLAEEFKKNG